MQVDLFTKLLLKRKKEKTQTNKQTNKQPNKKSRHHNQIYKNFT